MRKLIAISLALIGLVATLGARAQDAYPSQNIRFVVPFTAGSATDITARMFAQKLNAAWNVPVTVENVPGAGGSVGGDRVAKAADSRGDRPRASRAGTSPGARCSRPWSAARR